MAKKKKTDTDPSVNGQLPPETDPFATSPDAAPDASGNGSSDKRLPVYKVGPIACDKNTSVEAAVWENDVTLSDGRSFKTHNVTIHGSWRDADGSWKTLRSFRGSHLHVLIYVLQRCSDWILSQRDSANASPF